MGQHTEARHPELPTDTALVEVRGLKVYFPLKGGLPGHRVGLVRAVDGVDLSIQRGETLGLVGESGCGKSTLGRAILQLVRPTAGSVKLQGIELTTLPRSELRKQRAEMQMIFQDPFGSLDPRYTVEQLIAEPLRNFKHGSASSIREEVAHLLETVGLGASSLNRFAHEFSGGQRQRIGIARALALRPSFIVADEAVSALDVSIQAQVLNLLRDLQGQFGLTYLFIAHNLSVVKYISTRVAVMYLGHIVELAPGRRIYTAPLHPYTQALLSAVPVPDPEVEGRRKRILLEGDVPSATNPPGGCSFHPRCWKAQEICRRVPPPLEKKRDDHLAACHFPG